MSCTTRRYTSPALRTRTLHSDVAAHTLSDEVLQVRRTRLAYDVEHDAQAAFERDFVHETDLRLDRFLSAFIG